jgi:16S rRNA processing protein RimM
VKAFGIKGEVIVEPVTAGGQRFKRLREVFLGPSGETAVVASIAGSQAGPRGVRVQFKHLRTRTEAEAVVGQWLFVDEQHLVKLPRGAYHVHSIIGLPVVDEDDVPVGVVKEVWKLPANDVYVVDRDGRDILIPAVRQFVLSVDLRAGRMKVRLIEGMEAEG